MVQQIGAAQLGHRIAQLREQAGIKQAELARQITWSPAVLSRVEAGERAISDEELERLLTVIATSEAAELGAVLRRKWVVLAAPALDHRDHLLLWQAEQMAVMLNDLSESDVPPAFARRLQEYVEEICRRANLLNRRDHKVAFIGSIGIGKSTAICRAIGLEVQGEARRPKPVLETGAGGITLCEVHLRPGPAYGVVVEPRPHDEIRADVSDFADHLLRKRAFAGDGQPDDAYQAVPREIERAIRNMAGLQLSRKKGADGKLVRSDPAKLLAIGTPSKSELVVEILTRMNLLRRERRDDWFDASVAPSALGWLKSTFEKINNGRHPDFSLPARIELVLPEFVKIDDLEVSIIDTRGIDQPTTRADLEEYLEDPHTVAILCSGFNDAPEQSVLNLLVRARAISNPQIESNSSVLVLARPEEAMAVKDESGIHVESSEEGYELKSEQVSAALSPHGLENLPVGFFNAFDDDPSQLRDFIAERLKASRADFKVRLQEVLSNAQKTIDNRQHEQGHAVQLEASRHVSGWISLNKTIENAGTIHATLIGEIRTAHPSTVNAAVRRDGEWQILSYSHQLGYGARQVSAAAAKSKIAAFASLCETLEVTLPEAGELLAQASRIAQQAYDELLRKMQLAGASMYGDQLKQDPDFWRGCESEWGTGSGYRARVVDRNREWFSQSQRQDIESTLLTVLAREWEGVLERVSAIFEEE